MGINSQCNNGSNIILKSKKLTRDISDIGDVEQKIWDNVLKVIDDDGNIITDKKKLNIEIKARKKGTNQEVTDFRDLAKNTGTYILSYCFNDKVIEIEFIVKDRRYFLPLIFVSTFILIFILLLVLLIGGHSKPQYDGHAYDDPLKPGKIWKDGNLAIPGFKEVYVNRKSDEIKMILSNSKVNQAYFKFKVTVNQGNKDIVLENSKLVKPGNAITEISTKGLSMIPGRYRMKVDINAFSLKKSNAPLNSATVDGTLVIQ